MCLRYPEEQVHSMVQLSRRGAFSIDTVEDTVDFDKLTFNVDCSNTSSPFQIQTTLPSSAWEMFSPLPTPTAVYLCLCFPLRTTELASPVLETAGW